MQSKENIVLIEILFGIFWFNIGFLNISYYGASIEKVGIAPF